MVVSPEEKDSAIKAFRCFALPYGALGFLSHLLTYYTLIILYFGRRPFMPWWKLDSSILDIILAVGGMIGAVISFIIMLVRCTDAITNIGLESGSYTFPFFSLIALLVCQLFLTISQSVWTLSRTLFSDQYQYAGGNLVRVDQNDQRQILNGEMLCHYFCFVFPTIVDGAAIFALDIWIEGVGPTIGCLIAILLTFFLVLYGFREGLTEVDDNRAQGKQWRFFLLIMISCFFFNLMMVWALGRWTGNLVGTPSSSNSALYWTYWISKRLPMLSL